MRHSIVGIEEKERKNWGGVKGETSLSLVPSEALMSTPAPCHHASSFHHLINGNFDLLKPEISASLSLSPSLPHQGITLPLPSTSNFNGYPWSCLPGLGYQSSLSWTVAAASYVATLLPLSDPQPILRPLSLPSQKSLQTQEQLVLPPDLQSLPTTFN